MERCPHKELSKKVFAARSLGNTDPGEVIGAFNISSVTRALQPIRNSSLPYMRIAFVVRYSMDILTNAALSNESSYPFYPPVKPSMPVSNPPGRHIPTMATSNGRNFWIER